MSTKAGNAVEVSFRDNGYGISHPIASSILLHHERVGKGTGLGLSFATAS